MDKITSYHLSCLEQSDKIDLRLNIDPSILDHDLSRAVAVNQMKKLFEMMIDAGYESLGGGEDRTMYFIESTGGLGVLWFKAREGILPVGLEYPNWVE